MLVACSPLALLPGPPAGRRKGWRRLPALRALPGLTGGSGSSLEESKQQQPAIQQQAAAGQPPPPPPLTAAAANGSGPQQQQQQHASIQHPLFPEAQQPAARPWPVQTQRGIPTFVPSVERDRPCPQCAGTGKVTCGDCRCGGARHLLVLAACMLSAASFAPSG